MSTKEKIKEEVDVLEQKAHQHEIVLHNDEVNTFDFVIEALISVCEHTLEQALEFVEDDELVEVTPKSIRLRKRI